MCPREILRCCFFRQSVSSQLIAFLFYRRLFFIVDSFSTAGHEPNVGSAHHALSGMCRGPLAQLGRGLWGSVTRQYAERSQYDIVPGRDPDLGSSCCALFAATLAAGVMIDQVKVTSAGLETLLSQCVLAYDTFSGGGGGCAVEDVACLVFGSRGIELAPAQFVASRWVLADRGKQLLTQHPAALLITGIPVESAEGCMTGNTFAVLFCKDAIHVVDSHRHETELGQQGWVWAQSSQWPEMVTWIFDRGGLLEQMCCRTDFVDTVMLDIGAVQASPSVDVAPGQQPPTTMVHQVPEPVEAEVARAARGAEDARAACLHTEFQSRCLQCQWEKHKARFCGLSAYVDAVSFLEQSALALSSGDRFGIGCKLCARLARDVPGATQGGKRNKWATFEIRDACSVKIDNIQKHLRSSMHQSALQTYAAALSTRPTTSADSAPGKPPVSTRDVATDADERVPRMTKFVDAIRGCLQGHTFGGYAASHPSSTEMSSPLISTGVFRDESRWACRKMLQSAAAVVDDQQREMLEKAVRIAFSDDDRDQHRILRIRVVWDKPCIGYAEFFGALLKDYGFDAEACRDATMEGLKRLCTKRSGCQLRGVQTEFDAVMWDAVRRNIFCGATDGAAVAMKGVRMMASDLPALRYQFRDRPHTTRTCMKMALEKCPESREMRERLITGKKSFARRVKHSRRFREIWIRKQKQDVDALWNVTQDLGYAEQRYDSRSRPMSTFCEKLGPALQVLSELAGDLLKQHQEEARWARSLLQFLSGREGFLKMVMFAIDTDFAVATHKLVRLQDKSQPDVSLAAHEVQQCLDTCRTLFLEARIFDRAPNGTYTNHLLRGFAGVSQQLLLGNGASVLFGWPSAHEDNGFLKDAVEHAKKLYKAVSLFFHYNFPNHAWRTRFEAFSLSTTMSHSHRRGHILALAEKEGVDPHRAWEQFFEGFPHAMRFHKVLGDSRAAWSAYLDEFCRNPRVWREWRPHADCIVQLVFTFLGIMDGSSDVERSFSQMDLLECRRARRHHTEQVLQDLLKVRLHIPDEFQTHGADAAWSKSTLAFLRRAQAKYGEFFGLRRLASRSMEPVEREDKLALLLWRRPRWQHLAHKKKGASRTRAARLKTWESDVQRLMGERRLVAKEDSFVAHADVDVDSLLPHMSQVMAAKGLQQQLVQQEAERKGELAPPPGPIQKKTLLPPSAAAVGIKRKLVQQEAERKVVPRICVALSSKGKGLESIRFPEKLRVHFSSAAMGKHPKVVAFLAKSGLVVAQIGMESPSDKDSGTPGPAPGTSW